MIRNIDIKAKQKEIDELKTEASKLDIPVYVPDQELYPGQKFNSFVEMQKACPKIFIKKDAMDDANIPYTPYICHYVKRTQEDVV